MTESLSEQGVEAVAIIASEWFKTNRRLARLTTEAAPSRLERERAQLLFSRNRVEAALAGVGVRLVTHEGSDFGPEIPAEPVNPEDFDTDEGLVVSETLEPTVVHDGRIVARGRVVLARGE